MKLKQFFLGAIFLINISAKAQTIIIDSSFNNTGKVITDHLGYNDRGRTMAIQADGKIIVAGKANNDFIIIRYLTNGFLDTTFSGDGIATTDFNSTNDEGKSLSIQSDGKILLSGITTNTGNGNANFGIVRYNINGSLDTTFSNDGKQSSPIASGTGVDEGKSMVIQTDGKILVAGQSDMGTNDFSIVRYLSNGNLDTTFSGDGKQTTDFNGQNDEGNCIKLQSDGKILVAGYSFSSGKNNFSIVRYIPNGALDTTFGTGGKVTVSVGLYNDVAFTMEIQPDKKIILAGISDNGTNNDMAIIRLDSTGTIDYNFNVTGKRIEPIGILEDDCKTIAIQTDGKIILGGMSHNGTNKDFAFLRLNANGSIDSTFDVDGKLILDFNSNTDDGFSMLIQPDGKILMCGETQNTTTDIAVVRYKNNLTTGFNDHTYENNMVIIFPNPCTQTVAIKFMNTNNPFAAISIYNSFGQLVYLQTITEKETIISFNLPNGIYNYTLTDKIKTINLTGRLIVQN